MRNYQEKQASTNATVAPSEQAAAKPVTTPNPGSRAFVVEGVKGALQRAETSQALQRAESNQALQAKTGIPDPVRTTMESSLGDDFSNVRVHTNSSQAKSIGALAYTRGNDVHFAPGHYNPGSTSGRKLLGHELAHVVQQRQGRVQPTGSVGGMALNDSPKLEAEADRLGERAAMHKPSS